MLSNEQELFLNTVQNFQHCQRNFDLSQTVDDSTVNWLLNVGYSTPTKQNLDSFEIVMDRFFIISCLFGVFLIIFFDSFIMLIDLINTYIIIRTQ